MSESQKGRGRPAPEPIRPRLLRPTAEALELVLARIAAANEMLRAPIRTKAELDDIRRWFYTWNEGNEAMLRALFSTDEPADAYAHDIFIGIIGAEHSLQQDADELRADIAGKTRRLEGVIEKMKFMAEPMLAASPPPTDPLSRLTQLLRRFHRVARRLTTRHGGRNTLLVEDEYDVQDLLGALLAIDYDDVRPEEYTPSYAGGSARIDFLLKEHRIVVETKFTRLGHADREIGAELAVDIARYRSHPDAKILVCFVYDPEGWIANPSGLTSDLEQLGFASLQVMVAIAPGV